MLLSGLHELQIAEAFEQSPGLCVPHLMQALALEKESAAREYLVEKHRRAFSVLLGELEEFCRKRDYRYSHETYGKESDAWIRTVKMLLGGVL